MSPEQVYDNLNMPVRYKIPSVSAFYSSDIYIFSGCMIRKHPAGHLYYRAELKDNCSNSVIYVDLADVELAE